MRAIISTLWVCIGILVGCAQVTAASALTGVCQSSDPYEEPGTVVEACSKLLDEAATDANDRLAALRQRAEAFYWADRYDLAVLDLDAALAIDSKSVTTLRRRGWANLALNRPDEAFTDFTDALSLDPQNADTLFAIGFTLHHAGGSVEAARTAYEQALAIDPKHYLARGNLADLYFYSLNDADKALEHIDLIVSSNPAEVGKVRYKSFGAPQQDIDYYAKVRIDRAGMLLELKRFGLALEDADWFVDRNPKNVAGYVVRGDIHRYTRDHASALADAETALAMAPGNEDAQIIKLYALSGLGRRDEVVDFATQVIDGRSTDIARGDAYYFRGQARRGDNERDHAMADLEQSFILAPVYLVSMLQRMKARGYYEGDQNDGYSKQARVGLEACMIDPEC